MQKTVGPTKQALNDAGVDPSKIDEVVLVGGSTRIPRVQAIVKELFEKEPHKGVNPDEVVADRRRRFRRACLPAKSRICCCST